MLPIVCCSIVRQMHAMTIFAISTKNRVWFATGGYALSADMHVHILYDFISSGGAAPLEDMKI